METANAEVTTQHSIIYTNASSDFAKLNLNEPTITELANKAIKRASIDTSLLTPPNLTHWFAWEQFFLKGPTDVIWQVDTKEASRETEFAEMIFQSPNGVEIYRFFQKSVRSRQFKVLHEEDYLPKTFSQKRVIEGREWGYYTYFNDSPATLDLDQLCRPVGIRLLTPQYFLNEKLSQACDIQSVWTPTANDELNVWVLQLDVAFPPSIDGNLIKKEAKSSKKKKESIKKEEKPTEKKKASGFKGLLNKRNSFNT